MDYGIQLYSVRDAAEQDFGKTLDTLAKMGYTHMEFDEFFGHTAEEVKAMLDRNSLKVSGAHINLPFLDEDFDGMVKFHKAIGNTRFIVVGTRFKTAEQLAKLIADLNKYQPMLAAEGIELCLHNHHKEFLPNEDGQIPMKEIWENTNIGFEIDTYWAYIAGKDPVKVLEAMKDRVPLIHLKDGDEKSNGFSLGSGTAPVAQVRKKAMELGMHIVVESEGLEPDGISEVSRCMDWLKSLEA
jgi:sugar phosphate isomerase/epimerase